MARQFWTVQDLENLKTHYPDNRTADLLDMFPGRSTIAINSAANVYGLQKSAVFHAKGLGGRIATGSRIGIGTEFKKGLIPFNKGRKQIVYMCAQNILNSQKGCFKKGDTPHNRLPIGSERISKDGYIEVKVQDGKYNGNYEFKHRLMWKEHHGPIPKGMVVIIKVGNRQNFTINDLELISHREHVLRNGRSDTAIVKKFFGIKEPAAIEKIIAEVPGIIELKRTNLKINSQLNKTV